MTCQVCIETPQGSIKVRALLDSASEASFVSERIAQALSLQRHPQNVTICGIAGVTHGSNSQSLSCFEVSSLYSPAKKFNVTAIIVPRITHDLPTCHVMSDKKWKHLKGLKLADPDFGKSSKIDLLLGAELFIDVLRQGRRKGGPDSPAALETSFGWVLAGSTGTDMSNTVTASHHVSTLTGDDLLRQFWETEKKSIANSTLTPEERIVLRHFEANCSRTPEGRFVVPLPKRADFIELGESRTSAVRRFLYFDRSLHAKGQFDEFEEVMDEYFHMEHAERVPQADLDKPIEKVFYLPIHAVRKETSTTTKVRAVFDTSGKTSNGRSLNDILLTGPTVHPPLVDVLMRFRMHRIVLIADVSRMYRAILLTESDRDLHRFVWRSDINSPLADYRMTRLTFGVSSSSFVANMCVKQNASDHELEYPNAAKSVRKSFYVDDCLTGSNSVEEAIQLQGELQELFNKGGFLLRKWNSNDSRVIEHLPPELRNTRTILSFSSSEEYTKTLGIEWNPNNDRFCLTIAKLAQTHEVTKRALVSDIASTFDALEWYSPTIVKAKILLQMVWSEGIGWDDCVPEAILQEWLQWRNELNMLTDHHIARCHFPRDARILSIQLYGFSDASEKAYCGVVYIRLQDSNGTVHTSIVISKTRVAPIKRVIIPRLELCGALLLAQLLSHCKEVLEVPMDQVFAWTDSTIVLNWIQGNPRRFKIFVGNRVSQIMELLPTDRWSHVISSDNPADCGSHGLFLTELIAHKLWWNGPDWLSLPTSNWPKLPTLQPNSDAEEGNELCSLVCTVVDHSQPLFPFNRYSNFNHVKRVTAWIMRFIWNCRAEKKKLSKICGPLSVEELDRSANYWISLSQLAHFAREIGNLEKGEDLPRNSCLIPLHPILDEHGLLPVGGRQQRSQFSYASKHPLILHSKHPISKMMIRTEHERLLHAGALLLQSSLSRRLYFIGGHRAIRSITRSCVTCRHRSAKPKPPKMGQLPPERITPDAVFSRVGVDYAGPLYVKQGSVRKPVMVKAYVCVFVSLTVKAVHLELVSDMTTEAFIACLRRFIGIRGKPALIWSDHGSNFIGAKRVL